MNKLFAMKPGQNQNTSEGKLKRASSLLSDSKVFKQFLDVPAPMWAGILSQLDEKKVDDLLLILDEELSMRMGIKKKEERRLQINSSKYLQRLERLKIRAENVSANPSGDATI